MTKNTLILIARVAPLVEYLAIAIVPVAYFILLFKAL
jgi:hypothetical protein